MAKGRTVIGEQPEELKRKLDLIEGDRKAYFEFSQQEMKRNREVINALRRDNKSLTVKLKDMRAGPNAGDIAKATQRMDDEVAAKIKKLNVMRAQNKSKLEKLKKLERELATLDAEEASEQKVAGGKEGASSKLRQLENALDKAQLKGQEAVHIGKTYKHIIGQLEKERLAFDGKITEMERNISAHTDELVRLETMCNDAVLARDAARRELAAREAENHEARATREQEKRQLQELAEERRRQQENSEKRLRQAPVGERKEHKEEVSEETKQKITTYEEAMVKIQEITGVSDVQDVLERFLTQDSTQEKLQKSQKENEEQLAALRAKFDQVTREFEDLKYSGETRNTTGNQRALTDYEQQLTSAQQKALAVKTLQTKLNKVLVDVKTAVDHLHDKLAKLKPVQFRAAANVKDKLTESELRLMNLVEEVEQRKGEVAGFDSEHMVLLPEHNTRIRIPSVEEAGPDSESDDDDEAISRDAFKQHSQSLVDAKNKKGRKKR